MQVLKELPGSKPERLLGAYLGLPEGQYHAVKALSYTGSKELKRSPAHFLAYTRQEFEIDVNREKYKAAHLLTLEPEHHERIVVRDGTWRDKLKSEVYELHREGKIVLKKDKLIEAQGIAATMRKHSIVGPVLSRSHGEVSLFWEEDGAYCKARCDILAFTPAGIFLGDMKNFGNLSNLNLIWSQIGNSDYHWQMAFYSKGINAVFGENPIKRSWLFVEDSEPFGVRVVNCTDAMVEAANLEMQGLTELYKQCCDDEVWPCYPEEEIDGDLPAWKWGVVG